MSNFIKSDEFLDNEIFQEWVKHEKADIKNSYPLCDFSLFIKDFKMNVCVDIGSNLGLFSYFASRLFQNIYAFEAGYLASVSSKDLLHAKSDKYNIKIFNLAVSKRTGDVVKLNAFIPEDNSKPFVSGNNSLIFNNNTPEYEHCLTVSLEDVFKLIDKQFIDYLKIDCEGSEYDILLNKDLSNIGIIAGEIHCLPDKSYDDCKSEFYGYLEKYFYIFKKYQTFFAINKKFDITDFSKEILSLDFEEHKE